MGAIQDTSKTAQNKEAAKQCLAAADKYIKDSMFDEALVEIQKAKQLDPANAYINAFQDRVKYFQEQKKKEKQEAAKQCLVAADQLIKNSLFEEALKEVEKANRLDPSNAYIAIFKDRIKNLQLQKKEEKEKAVMAQTLDATNPPTHSPPPQQQKQTEPISSKSQAVSVPPHVSAQPSATTQKAQEISVTPQPKNEVESQLEAMKRQIQELTHALEQEKKVREEISKQQLQGAVNQLRTALQKAWVRGAPLEKETKELHQLAISLSIPEEVEQSVVRDVKLAMYSRAVKEVLTKRKLLRSSSSTLEWLRKTYQVTVDEYLEYESQFLMDLVADQYKGTILLITGDENNREDLSKKLKSLGYAVVPALTPENALEKIEKIIPHFIICEMEFSQASLSGLKFLHFLRVNSKFNYIPFILLCESNGAGQLQSSELRPNEGFVKKPVDFDELTSVMNDKLTKFMQYVSSLS